MSFWRWPGALQPADCATLAAHLDSFPTIAELAGATLPDKAKAQIEGRSLVPLLENPGAKWNDRTLFTHVGRWPKFSDPDDAKFRMASVRNKHWALVSENGGREPRWQLFDLQNDYAQKHNVLAEHPEVAKELGAAFDKWWADCRPLMVNENAKGPRINPFQTLYYQQFGGSPTPEDLAKMEPNQPFAQGKRNPAALFHAARSDTTVGNGRGRSGNLLTALGAQLAPQRRSSNFLGLTPWISSEPAFEHIGYSLSLREGHQRPNIAKDHTNVYRANPPHTMTHTTDAVFGVNRDLPLNYVPRGYADSLLVDNLSRGRHLVIYGSSKQGKTSLRKHCLKESDYISVHCSNKWSVADINTAILKAAGYEVTLSQNKSQTGKNKVLARAIIGFFGNSAEAGTEVERETTTSREAVPLELDQEDVNDIIYALKQLNFRRFIVLEDFHYLPLETQKDFSVSLKAYHENSQLTFIVVGVWLEENRLTVYNGDLTGRIFAINGDRWDDSELRQVINDGAALIGVTFAEGFVTALLGGCNSSVSLVQEVCHSLCIERGIYNTRQDNPEIGTEEDALRLLQRAVNQHTGRYYAFLHGFADGFQSTTLEMHKWLLHPVLCASSDQLIEGLRQKHIREALQRVHPQRNELNPGNVTQALQSCASLQVKKGVKPIVLDYDETSLKLRVVDRAFLIWLNQQDRAELLSSIGLPVPQ